MPRNNVRKTTIGLHSEQVMKQAIELICDDSMSVRGAAKRKGIPYATLYRYYKKSIKAGGHIRLTPNYSVNKLFTDEQEASLVDYIVKCSQMFYGLTPKDVRSLAYEMAVVNKIRVPPKWHQYQIAGIEWLYGFRKRPSNLSLRMPEGCSLSRATSFNRHNVKTFYDNLCEAMSRNPRFGDGTRVYNLDETNTMTVQVSGKILAPRGQKQVSKVTSAEKGTLVSTCYIVSASGHALPPVMVFPRVHFKSHMIKDAPAGTLGLATPSGWMNSELFVPTMQHFIDQTQSSTDNPSLLIMDNYEAHISLQVINLAKENGVTVLTVPPHSTGKLQPLDVAVFGPFKKAYNRAVDSWMMRNPGHTFTIYDVAGCVKEAHMIAMTPANICSGFAATGIFPYNCNIFNDVDFAPSEITDRPLNEGNAGHQAPLTRSPTRSPTPSIIQDVFVLEGASALQDYRDEQRLLVSPQNMIPELPRTPPLLEASLTLPAREPSAMPLSQHTLSLPSSCGMLTPQNKNTSESPRDFINPFELRGLPKAGPRKNNRAPRRKGKSMIATDTPNKDEIEEREKMKNQKKIKPLVKKIKKKVLQSDESSNEGENDKMSIYSEEEGCFEDEDIDPEIEKVIDPRNFTPIIKSPAEGSFILVQFEAKAQKIFYIGKVINENLGSEIEVSFLRKSLKNANSFRLPNVPDIAAVALYDIKLVLPTPYYSGQTKRQQGIYTFDVDFSKINMR